MDSFSPAQCRAARGLLGWSQADLAEATALARPTIERFERGQPANRSTVQAIVNAFERAGVVADLSQGEGAGVRFIKAGGAT